MFESLSEKISGIFSKLRSSGVLKESDVDAALREIRIALLEADVALEVARKFMNDVREKAVGQEVIKSVSPAHMVIKIVHDHLMQLFGSSLATQAPSFPRKMLMVGLQGAGKTTTAAKLANLFVQDKKRVIMASTDVYRPAAIEQLRVLSKKVSAHFIDESTDMTCEKIVSAALDEFRQQNGDVLIVDTAGRLHIDEMKMNELQKISRQLSPDDIYLIVDIMTGQDAINIARKFSETLNLTGIILTRVDGDARGGVALSMKSLTDCDIKYLCVGEAMNAIEQFDAERVVNRMLGMGDIVALVEKAQEAFSKEDMEDTAQKLQSGVISLDDYANQIEKVSKLGGLSKIIKMLPQSQILEKAAQARGVSDKTISHDIAIIRSMTAKERKNYKIINGRRKKRIAAGSGTTVQDVNRLLKQYEGTLSLFKRMKNFRGLKQLFGGSK